MKKFPEASSQAFGLPESFWGWLDSDAELKREFDRMIEIRVTEGVADRFEELKEKVRAEAHDEGFRSGLETAEKALVDVRARLDGVCAEVLKEKTALLHSHENQWIRTFSHLLRRFLVSKPNAAIEQIAEWLTESIGAFDTSGKLRIHLSPGDYKTIAKAMKVTTEQRWVFFEDHTLQNGQIHCECEDGGILFSSKEEMEKLELWIDRFVARDKGGAV